MDTKILPALRGVMGDWIYYVTMMTLNDVALRVNFAKEVHKNEALSQLIQRQLDKGRGKKIAEYLQHNEQRFFNAMVVGVYGGDPCWYDFAEITSLPSSDIRLPADLQDQLGFLGLNGNEVLFAIDGQHRLSGIKLAMDSEVESDLGSEQIAVVFVSHQKGAAGLQRTRRLFTVLNKTARPVLKGDIIALDEDDVMAICTRWLVDESPLLSRGQVAMRLMSSLPPSDTTSWTTISMLYDILTIVFEKIYHPRVLGETISRDKLKHERPATKSLRNYYAFAEDFFKQMAEAFPEVASVLTGDNPGDAVMEYRHTKGGSILFRPVGQRIFVQVIEELAKSYSLEESFEWASLLPTSLVDAPFAEVIWNTGTQRMSNASTDATLVKEILLYMLKEKTKTSKEGLRERYAQYFDRDPTSVELPEPVVT